jgi:hypothetical protein
MDASKNFQMSITEQCFSPLEVICISNDGKDVLTFTPSTLTILPINCCGLPIAGQGVISWKIIAVTGDEVALHLHDTLYLS